jgi:hypothetical protein
LQATQNLLQKGNIRIWKWLITTSKICPENIKGFKETQYAQTSSFVADLGKTDQKHTECLKLFMEMKLLFVPMSLNDLKDSEVSGPWRRSKEWVAITAWHLEAVVKVCEMVARDHSMTLKLMEDQLHINRGTSHQIPREDFGKRQIWVKFVPHGLMDKLILPWQLSASWWIRAWCRAATHLIHLTSCQQTFLFHKGKILGHRGHQE